MIKFRTETTGENQYLVIEEYYVSKVGTTRLLSKKYLRMLEGESSADAIKRYEVEQSKGLQMSKV